MAAVMKELENTNSFPYIEREVTLVTKPTQEVYKRVYKALSRAHVNIGVVIRVRSEIEKGSELEMADQAEQTLAEMYTTLRDEVSQEHEILDKLLEDKGITELVKYTSEKIVNAPVHSPEDNEYIALLGELDALVTKFDTLWLSGVFTSKQKVVSTMEWKRKLMKHSARIIDLSNKMRARMRKETEKDTPAREPSEDVTACAVASDTGSAQSDAALHEDAELIEKPTEKIAATG